MSIEKDIVPETVNEVLLLNRIRELKTQLWRRGPDLGPYEEPTYTLRDMTPPETLHLAGYASVQDDDVNLRLRVKAIGRGPGFGLTLAHYLDKTSFSRMNRVAMAHRLGDIHLDVIKQLAHLIEKGDEG